MAGPWEKYAQQPQGPAVIGVPRPEKPRDPPAGYQEVPGGLAPIPGGPADPTRPGGALDPNKPKTPATNESAVKLQQKRASLSSLETQINRVEELYRKGFRDEAMGVLSSLAEYLPTNKAAQFNAAAAGLAEQGLSAFRVPGVGSQSDAELRQFVQANKPSSWDRDEAIEEKLRQLRTRVDATRAEMGMEPAKWLPESAESPVYDGNLGGETLVRTTTGTRTVDNPELKGVRGEYLRRLEAGQSASEIVGFLRKAGIDDPKILRSAVEQVQFRRQNPGVPVSKYNTSAMDDMDVPLTTTERVMNSAAQSAPGAYLMHAGNAVTANTLDNIVGATGGNAERARIALDDARSQNPLASLAGGLSGGVLAAMTGEAGLSRIGASGIGRALAADSGYGAAAGAGAADGEDRLQGALMGGAAGLGGSLAGNALARGAGNVLSGVTDRSVNALMGDRIPLTIGQAVGRSGRVGQVVKGVEDRASGLPVVGDMVNARRTEGVRTMNSRAFDKALEPISAKVGDKVGEEAVQEAHGLVQQAFRDALAGKSAVLDVDFVRSAATPINRLRQIRRNGLGEEVVEQIEEATRGYFDPATGEITGENMQALLGSLRQIRQAYKSDPLGNRIAGEVRKIEAAVEGIFERQTPEVMPKYRNAKQAYRRVATLANAVNRAKNREGVFTPGQLGMSDRANSVKFDGEVAAASGKSQFHDFQRAAQDVLPNDVPDSGTAGRLAALAIPGAVAGGTVGYAAGDTQSGAATGLGLATIVSALYSRQGQRALVALAAKRGPKAKAAGKAIKGQARIAGAVGAQAAINSR